MTVEHAYPDYAVPTGEFISEWLDEHDMSQAEFARRLGVTPKHVSKLISGDAPLSHAVAHDLELVTGIEARIWNGYEALYREDLERLRSRTSFVQQFQEIVQFPLEYLRQRGYITSEPGDKEGVTRDVLKFFGVADLDAWRHSWAAPQAAYKKALSHKTDDFALATWLRLGELEASRRKVPPFDAGRLTSLLPQLRALTITPVEQYGAALDGMVELSASAGVIVVFEPEIPGTRCYGATRWVHNTPIVQLSARGKKDDHLWFTFFHELGHVLKHPRNTIFIEEGQSVHTAAEEEANRFAADLLIDPADLPRLPKGRNKQAVRAFAKEIGVSPGIVVGRIHRETGSYNWGHDLKVTLKFHQDG